MSSQLPEDPVDTWDLALYTNGGAVLGELPNIAEENGLAAALS